MDYRELGRTGVRVSAVCLGTMTFGQQNSEAEGHAQMDYAVDRGVNIFDAAELYPIPPKPETQGRTEEIIGTWLASRKARDKVMIATKAIEHINKQVTKLDERLDKNLARVNKHLAKLVARAATDEKIMKYCNDEIKRLNKEEANAIKHINNKAKAATAGLTGLGADQMLIDSVEAARAAAVAAIAPLADAAEMATNQACADAIAATP